MPRGRLITVEGIDGAGKTTLVDGLSAALRERGIPVEALREPGGVPAAERIRAVVTDPGLAVAPRTEALLFAAARAQLVEEALRPALEAGSWVLLDRFLDSSLAYQGAGRGLGVEAVRAVNAFALADLRPDRTLLLRLPADVGRGRARGDDRLEREEPAYFARVATGYEGLARAEPERVRVLDATRGPREVLAAALAELEDLTGRAGDLGP